MKFLLCVLFFVFGFSDITKAVNEIKYIEKNRSGFKNVCNYDPFGKNKLKKKVSFPKKRKNDIILKAIFSNRANINGKWVKEGGYVNGFKVMKIMQDGVYLIKEGKIIFLKLSTSSVIKVSK